MGLVISLTAEQAGMMTITAVAIGFTLVTFAYLFKALEWLYETYVKIADRVIDLQTSQAKLSVRFVLPILIPLCIISAI